MVLVGLLIAGPASSSAQTMKLQLGVHLGVNLSRSPYDSPGLEGSDVATDKLRPGFGGGGTITLTFPGQERVSFETGLGYHARGGTTEFRFEGQDSLGNPTNGGLHEYEWKLAYLTVPFALRVSLPVGSVGTYVKAGMEAAALVGAKRVERHPAQGDAGAYEIEADIGNWLTNGDIGLVVAVGTDVPVGRAFAFAEVGYTHGLTDVLDPQDAFQDATLHNRTISLTAGIRL
jgi:hypothetical protein